MTSTQHETSPDQPEIDHLNDQELQAFLNGVANHEAKLLTAGLLLASPDEWFTRARLYHAVKDHQGEHPGWETLTYGHPISYCQESLEPIGMVVKEMITGQRGSMVVAYKAVENRNDDYLALIGMLSDWSLKYPNRSLQRVLGNTASKGDARSPQIRYQIYLDLLTSPNDVSAMDITRSIDADDYKDANSVTRQIQMLRDNGIVELDSKSVHYDPIIHINDPTYRSKVIPFENVSAETQAVYKIVAERGKNEGLLLSELIVAALEHNPTLNITRLRQKVLAGAGNGTGFAGLEIIDEEDAKSSHVALEGSIEQSIRELCEGLESIKSGQEINGYAKRAREILNDPISFSALMAKGMRFSASHNGNVEGRQQLQDNLLGLARKYGALTTRKAMELLQAEHGRQISLDTTRVVLNQLVELDLLANEKILTTPSRGRLTIVYRPTLIDT